MSPEDLGAKVGVSRQQIQKYEDGTNATSIPRLVTLGKILGVEVRYLVEGMPDAPGLAWPLSEWHEDIGPVVWWRLCRDERLDEAC